MAQKAEGVGGGRPRGHSAQTSAGWAPGTLSKGSSVLDCFPVGRDSGFRFNLSDAGALSRRELRSSSGSAHIPGHPGIKARLPGQPTPSRSPPLPPSAAGLSAMLSPSGLAGTALPAPRLLMGHQRRSPRTPFTSGWACSPRPAWASSPHASLTISPLRWPRLPRAFALPVARYALGLSSPLAGCMAKHFTTFPNFSAVSSRPSLVL